MLSFSRSLSSTISQFSFKIQNQTPSLNYGRQFSLTILRHCTSSEKPADEPISQSREDVELTAEELRKQSLDRTKVIPVETSLRYLKSAAYQESYGNYLVWQQYRRNHKGIFAPKKTRKTCIRQGKISCGNPCPICRDEYLVLDHRNIELLKQFISPQTGQVLSYSKTGLCQKRHFELLVAVERAMDYGLLTFDVPFRQFDYSEYYSHLKEKTLKA
ncbi:28S ribosomal protein S18b, mitochondrial [Episyrphus balteatus]|uniref:28S ribosomal protein S18b, mitochondrial n=1 Tax=Episyrphus balteatus TaxID=286459 RepID=UPI002484DE68|nr:28S ribosomal protein S18b, mitochondrial [Episyrphus balteatus]